MLRTLFSLGTIVFVVAVVATGTTAFFSDEETSEGNTFTAGAVDLQIDNESYYNGAFNEGTSWELADLSDGQGPGPDGAYLFFNFLDVKPDDEGEDTISLHVDDNDAWACMDITVTSNDENGCSEPEGDVDETCDSPGPDQGELAGELNFVWWNDDGDNVLESNESELTFFGPAALSEMTQSLALADANGQGILSEGPLTGGETYYIGKAWCFGDLNIAPIEQDGLPGGNDNGPIERGTGIECDGSGLGNETQTDTVTADVGFTAVQSRNNDGFVCDNGGGFGCSEEADIMLVLDRSGSIASANAEDEVRDAAKAFVSALSPSADGVHIGLASFAADGSLDVHLTDDASALNTAIDGLTFTGNTNLAEGIDLADDELDDAHVHDRDDTTAPDFIVIITDGEPNAGGGEAGAKTEADEAKGNGVEIFAVGVDITTDNADFLRDDIVSPLADDHYFDSADFSDLEDILVDLTMCEIDDIQAP